MKESTAVRLSLLCGAVIGWEVLPFQPTEQSEKKFCFSTFDLVHLNHVKLQNKSQGS